VLWEASDRICGKRLKALLPSLIEAMERHGHLRLQDGVKEQLLVISAATIDRLLRPGLRWAEEEVTLATWLGPLRRFVLAHPLGR